MQDFCGRVLKGSLRHNGLKTDVCCRASKTTEGGFRRRHTSIKRSCKELHEAKEVYWLNKGLSAADLALLGTLG